jgi:hypothetical protein
LWLDSRGYRWPQQQARMMQSYHDTCPWHAAAAFAEMESHEFLSEDLALQRTRFAGNMQAVVNFADEPRACEFQGQEVVLAPRGYAVHGPGFTQTRLWRDAAAETVIEGPGYLTVESAGRQIVRHVRCRGRVTLWQTDVDRWEAAVPIEAECELRVEQLTGWPSGEIAARWSVEEAATPYEGGLTLSSDGILRIAPEAPIADSRAGSAPDFTPASRQLVLTRQRKTSPADAAPRAIR